MEKQEHPVDFVFTLLTFLIYAASMLMLVYMGTVVYRQITVRMNMHDTERTAQAYIMEKVRQNDMAGAIRIGEVEGKAALLLSQEIAEQEFITYIYEDEGYLKEQFVKADREPEADKGTKLTALAELTLQQDAQGLIRVTAADADEKRTVFAIRPDSGLSQSEKVPAFAEDAK